MPICLRLLATTDYASYLVMTLYMLRIHAGPVCTLHLPHHIPPGLHGSFSDRTDSVHMTPPPAATPEDWQPSFNTIPH